MNNNDFCLADAIDAIMEVLDSGASFRIYPSGVSMRPLITQGRDAVVLVKSEAPVKKHDIAFYRRKDGHFVLHRVMRIEADGTYTMCGDNQLALEKGIEPEQIIARVSEIYRKKKKVDVYGIAYRTYVCLWTKRPIRWIAFFPRRAFAKIKRIFRRLFSKYA